MQVNQYILFDIRTDGLPYPYSMAMKPMRAAAAAPPAMVREVAPLEPVVCEEEEPVDEA